MVLISSGGTLQEGDGIMILYRTLNLKGFKVSELGFRTTIDFCHEG